MALFCTFLWGCAFPCIKIGYELFDITSTGQQILFAGYRFTLAGIAVFAAGCLMQKRIVRIPKGTFGAVLLIGFVQTTLEYLFFYIGLAHISGSKSSIINSVSTFVAILLAHFLIKGDKIDRRKLLGCLMGLAGVVIINLGGVTAGFSFTGEVMILLSASAYGAGSVLTKMVSDRIDPVSLTAYQLLFGGFILVIIGFASGASITFNSVSDVLLMAYMVFISAAAFGIWTALLKYNSVSKVTIFNFTIPLFGVILSNIFLGENIMSVNLLISLILVAGGIVIVNKS